MFKQGDIVYAINVDIQNEEDWTKFISLADWFEDDAPLDDIKRDCLNNPGWVHFLDIQYINMFMFSKEWIALRDSGLAVAIKRCVVTVEGYTSPNDVYSKSMG